MGSFGEPVLCQCGSNSTEILDFTQRFFNSSWNQQHQREQQEHVVSSDQSRMLIGSIMLTISFTAMTIEAHVLQIIIFNRMWRLSFFYLWFISQGCIDFACLLTNIYGCLTVIFPSVFLYCRTSKLVGDVTETSYHVSLPHYLVLAFVRYVSIKHPIHFHHYVKTTVLQIALLWVCSLVSAALFLNLAPGNSVYFHPVHGSWVLACGRLYSVMSDIYWGLIASVVVSISLTLYILCWVELKRQRTQYQRRCSSESANRQAENNILAIGVTMTIVLLMENIFWRIGASHFIRKTWWNGFSITIAQILRCGSNPILLLIMSSEIRMSSFCLRRRPTSEQKERHRSQTSCSLKNRLSTAADTTKRDSRLLSID